ncbi:MAG: right-handed parallel beta-helix repeat-containing protein [Treponema sp.]
MLKKIRFGILIVLSLFIYTTCKYQFDLKDYVEKGFTSAKFTQALTFDRSVIYNSIHYLPSGEVIIITVPIGNRLNQELSATVSIPTDAEALFQQKPVLKTLTTDKAIIELSFKPDAEPGAASNYAASPIPMLLALKVADQNRPFGSLNIPLYCNTQPLKPSAYTLHYDAEQDSFTFQLPDKSGIHKDLDRIEATVKIAPHTGERPPHEKIVSIPLTGQLPRQYELHLAAPDVFGTSIVAGKRSCVLVLYDKTGLSVQLADTDGENYSITSVTFEPQTSTFSWEDSKTGIPLPMIKELKEYTQHTNGTSALEDWKAKGFTVTAVSEHGTIDFVNGVFRNKRSDGQAFTEKVTVTVTDKQGKRMSGTFTLAIKEAVSEITDVYIEGTPSYTANKQTDGSYKILLPHGASYTDSNIKMTLKSALESSYDPTTVIPENTAPLGAGTGSSKMYTVKRMPQAGSPAAPQQCRLIIERDKNHSAFLHGIRVGGTPLAGFTPEQTDYQLQLASDAPDPVVIAAELETAGSHDSSGASITINGTSGTQLPVSVPAGTTRTVNVTVKAENGTTNTYKLALTREENYTVRFSVTGGLGGSLTGQCGVNSETATGTAEKVLTVVRGASVTFTAEPDTGWEVACWTGVTVTPPDSTTATLSGISESQTVTVTFKRSSLPVLTIKQDFAHTDSALHSISAAAKGYVTEDIIADAGQYTSAAPLVIYNKGSKVRLSLTPPTGAAVQYTINGGSVQTGSGEIALDGAALYKVEVWAKKDGGEGLHSELHIKVINGVTLYSELKNLIQNAPSYGTEQPKYSYTDNIPITISTDLAASADTELVVSEGKKLILHSSAGGTIRTIDVQGSGRIFKISSRAKLTLDDIKIEGGNAADGKGGAAYLENGGILALKNGTLIQPPTEGNKDQPGKNDVYIDLEQGSSIHVNDLSTSGTIVARITPTVYSKHYAVLSGSSAAIQAKYTQFTVTPKGVQRWEINDQGFLTLKTAIIDGNAGDTWKQLKKAAANAQDGDTITIKGEIKATADGSGDTANWGEIVINKNLTIQGESAASSILNANQTALGTNAHRIFTVKSGNTLRLEKLTLKDGKTAGTGIAGSGGGILVNGGTVSMTDCTIKDCTAGGDGGAIHAEGASAVVRIAGGEISGNTANQGGGISIGDNSKLYINTNDAGDPDGASTPTVIKNNHTDRTAAEQYASGGAIICRTNTELKLHNMQISYCGPKVSMANTRAYGAGLTIVDGKTAALTAVEISHCGFEQTDSGSYAEKHAGAIFIAPCITNVTETTVTLGREGDNSLSCKIHDNNGGKRGGGIINNRKITIYGGRIENNTADEGGGISADSGTLIVDGTIIASNTATKGGGVYVRDGSFTMQGSTSIPPSTSGNKGTPGKNDVYLKSGKMITLDTPLSGTASVARITPENYGTAIQVLTGNTVSTEYSKFTVTPESGTPSKLWEIKSDGYLQKTPVIIEGTQPQAWQKLKDAVASAEENDTITIKGEIKATTAFGNSGEIVINKNLTIQGKNGKDTDSLNANRAGLGTAKAHRIFSVDSGKTLTLKNLALKNATAPASANGGAIFATGSGSMDISHCMIESCEAYNGGAIAARATITLTSTLIKNCRATATAGKGGAIYASGGALTMTDCTVSANQATDGGGIYATKNGGTIAPTMKISDSTFGSDDTADANKAAGNGGTLWVMGYNTAISNCTIKGSTANNGGALYLDGTAVLTHVNILYCKATAAFKGGGGIYTKGGTVEITGCTLAGNTAMSGGAIYADGSNLSSIKINGGTIGGTGADANKAIGTNGNFGGGIFIEGTGGSLTLKDNAQVTGNKAFSGGGIYAKESAVTVENAIISGNTVSGNHDSSGGGIYIEGTGSALTLKDNAKVTGNKAPHGGGVYANQGVNCTMEQCAVSGNEAGSLAGGIIIQNGSTLTLKNNAEITGNKAHSIGGGVYINTGNCVLELQDGAKVTNNTAIWKGGGIYIAANGAQLTMSGGEISSNTVRDHLTNDKETSGGGVYVSQNSTFTMTAGIIKENRAIAVTVEDSKAKGGGVCIEGTNSKFIMKGSAAISGNQVTKGSSGTNSTTIGNGVCVCDTAAFEMGDGASVTEDNDVYLDSNGSSAAVITVTRPLTKPHTAKLTLENPTGYAENRAVVKASTTGLLQNTDIARFPITPQSSGQVWTTQLYGNELKLKNTSGGTGIINGTDPNAWKTLKEKVETGVGEKITVQGTLKADLDNNEITVNRKVEIVGDGAGAELDADGLARIFKIAATGKLTLKNLTLKKGFTNAVNDFGGAIYTAGELTVISCKIIESKAKESAGGAIYVAKGGKCTITGTSARKSIIEKNEASKGGGIHTDGECTIGEYTVIGGSTENANKGKQYGGGMLVGSTGKCTVKSGVEISYNILTATGGSYGAGIYVEESAGKQGELILQGASGNMVKIQESNATKGGGIYVEGKVSMQYTEIKNCTAKYGGGIYLKDQAYMKMERNSEITDCAIVSSVGDGGGVYVEKDTCIFEMTANAKVSVSTGSKKDTPGANDIYLNSANIKVTETLSAGLGQAGRITPNHYTAGDTVLTGDNISANSGMFTVTKQTKPTPQNWKISSTGTLQIQ